MARFVLFNRNTIESKIMAQPLRGSREYNDWLEKRGRTTSDKNYNLFKNEYVRHFIFLGFRDYLASRKLLLQDDHDYYLVGLILASSTIEKYLKAFICASDFYIEYKHLDKDLDAFKQALKKIEQTKGSNYQLLRHLDLRFLQLLSDTYRFRYFDETDNSDGALINHVLAELDHTVHTIETSLTISKEGDTLTYQKAVVAGSHSILENNYVLQGIDKKKFMEKVSKGYGVKAIGDGMIIEVKSDRLQSKYKGNISTFKIDRKDR